MKHRACAPLTFLLGAASLAAGCAPVGDVGETSQEIIQGATSDPVPLGVVLVGSTAGMCSGTLLTNRWVLTARHCFDATSTTTPSSVTVSLGAQQRSAAEVILSLQRDVALLRLSAPMVMNGSTTGWERNLAPGPAVGSTVRCMGYGRNTYEGGAGVFRYADVPVSDADAQTFTVEPNRVGQVPWKGDSGGPCMVTAGDGRQMAAGVASTASYDDGDREVLDATYVNAYSFREWVAEVRTTKELVARHSGRCVEARNLVTANGRIEQNGCDGTPEQRWRFDAAGVSTIGELYRIRDADSGKCLTVPSGQSGDGVALILSPCGVGDNQRFVLEDMGGGFRRIRNMFSNRCVDVPSSSTADGVSLQQFSCHAGANQQFSLRVHVDDGAHEVSGVGSGRCFDIGGFSTAPRAPLQQYACNLGTNQAYRFEEVANGEFRVHPKHSNLCLDVADASLADNAAVQQSTCHGNDNQRFRMLYVSGGVYQLQAVHSGRCVDVPNASSASGVALQQFGCHSLPNQRWRLRM